MRRSLTLLARQSQIQEAKESQSQIQKAKELVRRYLACLRQPIMISDDGAYQCLCTRMAMEQGPAAARLEGIKAMINKFVNGPGQAARRC